MRAIVPMGFGSMRRGILLASVAAMLALSGVWAGTAQAIQTHEFVSVFANPSLAYPYGTAVDNSAGASSGDVYVASPPIYPPKVLKFDANGHKIGQLDDSNIASCAGARAFANPFGIAVDPTNGEVYVSDFSAETVTAFDSSGTCLFQIEEGVNPYGIAVDPTHGTDGILYVASASTHLIQSFDAATGAPISSFGSGPGTIFSLAVDSAGNLFADNYNEKVVEYDPTGECINECAPVTTGPLVAIAINPSNDHLLATAGGQIAEYYPGASVPATNFGAGYLAGLNFGVAVNAATNRVYTSDYYYWRVAMFDPGATVPNVTTGPVTNPGQTSATITGHVDPDGAGDVTSCDFEYGTDGSYSLGTIPCEPLVPISGATEVHADLKGLTAETTYHYRLVVANANGSNAGQDRTVTPHAVNGLQTEPATAIARTAAQLNGSFVGNGEDTHYYFEWGTDPSYGHTTTAPPGVDAGSAAGLTPLSASLSGLTPQTEYHFRIVAANGTGTTHGEDQAFRTPPAVVKVRTEAATAVTRTAAQLNGSFVGNGEDTHYYFEWGTDTSYGHTTTAPPGVDAGSGSGPTPVSASLSGLTPQTEYHFRIVAANAVGTTFGEDRQFTSVSAVPKLKPEFATGITRFAAQLNGSFVGNGEDTHYYFEWGTDTSYGHTTAVPPGLDAGSGTGPTPLSAGIAGLSPQTEYHFRIVAENAVGKTVSRDRSFFTLTNVAAVNTEAATNITPTSAQLHGSFVGNGEDTHYYFEWGTDLSFGHTTAVPPGVDAGSGAGFTPVSFNLNELGPITTYYFRLVASNAVGTTYGPNENFTTPPLPPVISESVTGVHSESATLHAQINPGGGDTKYRFEYATAAEYEATHEYGNATPVPDGDAGSALTSSSFASHIEGLTAGTTYHWRLVASNVTATVTGPDRTFTTFPFVQLQDETCANSHVRQQTGAAQLLDCRAYELVSAADTAGYDVVSDLVPDQTPYPDSPEAESPSRVLYSVQDGGIPGTSNPTNRGPDPYVATRDPEQGWGTEYVGVPANNPFSAEPFSSVRSGADAQLQTFAFGGAEGCSPCFAGGYTGIPVRLPDGSLVQGMSGPQDPGPGAKPDGYIAKDLSANGEHFIFGSTSRFAPGGNDGTGDVSIYDHNLLSGETHAISNTEAGTPIPCAQGIGSCHSPADANGIAELDISNDGSHVLLGQKVATSAGNTYWHLYMSVGDSLDTIDLTPGATDGVLYAGMTADGSEVFFTTLDPLSAGDTDTSADLYKAALNGSGATVTRISTGTSGAGNTNSCDPVANSNGLHWNSLGSAKNCNVLAVGGGAGVAAGQGSAYLLSPEQLDGAANGTANQPNLYVVAPGGAPHFIATLDPEDPLVLDALKEAQVTHTADFQVSANGRYAVFATTRQVTEFDNAGYAEVYRYDSQTPSLDCASCDPSNAEPLGSASMARNGLSIAEDGRVFFNSDNALVLRDSDNRQDVYEWEPLGTGNCQTGNPSYVDQTHYCLSLISSGVGQFASSLLGASASGTDAYFFARESLTPQVDNGKLVRIYDARELGGFAFSPPHIPCKASDECHGAGSPVPPIPTIPSAAGSGGNAISEARHKCKRGFVRKHGKCVRKQAKHRHGTRHGGGKS